MPNRKRVARADEDIRAETQGAEPRDVIAIQPVPIGCELAHLNHGPCRATSILREWREGDTARCGLCPPEHCTGRGRNYCVVLVDQVVPHEKASLFSTVGLAWVDGLGRGDDLLPGGCTA